MSYYILTGRNSLTALLASLLVFFMVNNLFLLSQFDEHVETWWRGLSFRNARLVSGIVYAAFWTFAYISVVAGCAAHRFPDLSMATWLTYYFALPASIGAVRFSFDIEKMIPFENQTIALCLATPLILSLTLIIG
jgi:1,4-dihydroxy-2-naphthoate octaprenyltransferase